MNCVRQMCQHLGRLTVAYRATLDCSPTFSSSVPGASPWSAQRPATRTQSAAKEEEGLFLKLLALVVLALAIIIYAYITGLLLEYKLLVSC